MHLPRPSVITTTTTAHRQTLKQGPRPLADAGGLRNYSMGYRAARRYWKKCQQSFDQIKITSAEIAADLGVKIELVEVMMFPQID